MSTRQPLAEPLNINDVFEFDEDKTVIPTLIEDAFADSLSTRGIDLEALSSTKKTVFDQAIDVIDSVLDAEIETSADVSALVGDTLDVTFVDDFSTVDGTALDGAALLESNRIILDSALEGDDLRAVLAEELAETAFQQTYGTTSAGDFGAEVLARINGEQDEDVLATYSKQGEADTVQTEAGTAEADLGLDFDSSLERFVTIMEDFADLEVRYALDAPSDEYETLNDRVYNAAQVTGEWDWGQSIFGTTSTDLRAIATDAGAYDFDGDGDATDEFNVVIYNSSTDSFHGGGNSQVGAEVINVDNEGLVPIDGLSAQWLVAAGDYSYQVRKTEGTTYTTSTEFNWSTEISASYGFEGGGLKASGTVTVGTGGAVTETNEFTSSVTTVDTITLTSDTYPEGTLVSVGAHAGLADITATDDYIMVVKAIDEGGVEGHFYLAVSETDVVEDYLLEVVQTDMPADNLILG
ncbi:hypothetical protein [uncultured Tateyamaria sp.]|uniref:hypothetical protein n=1 Tax=uncultured Tateyamaria sp. TaxID=455651 RepID=UPI002633A0F3|nr:hypothetical protein [uncultured Tateyamaria sp.]